MPSNTATVAGKMARFNLATFSTDSVEVLDLAKTDPHLKGIFGGFSDGKFGYTVPWVRCSDLNAPSAFSLCVLPLLNVT